ncbi:MAG: m-phase inducer phosphatase 2 [Trebouxia sp. A1-2]|nr:MAG: m-phase inducer phosphatase 2 [Trebouxia sp. A1-2]
MQGPGPLHLNRFASTERLGTRSGLTSTQPAALTSLPHIHIPTADVKDKDVCMRTSTSRASFSHKPPLSPHCPAPGPCSFSASFSSFTADRVQSSPCIMQTELDDSAFMQTGSSSVEAEAFQLDESLPLMSTTSLARPSRLSSETKLCDLMVEDVGSELGFQLPPLLVDMSPRVTGQSAGTVQEDPLTTVKMSAQYKRQAHSDSSAHGIASSPALGATSSAGSARRKSLSPLDTGPVSILPMVENPETGLPSITCQTLAQLLTGQLSTQLTALKIIDCRYIYEHAGGHISGAVNIAKPDDGEAFTFGSDATAQGHSTVVVLYCEFSSERAPRMFRYLRNMDRRTHLADYPNLTFPHMFMRVWQEL